MSRPGVATRTWQPCSRSSTSLMYAVPPCTREHRRNVSYESCRRNKKVGAPCRTAPISRPCARPPTSARGEQRTRRASRKICPASSRVGARMSTVGHAHLPCSAGRGARCSSRFSTGSKNAAVLPEPAGSRSPAQREGPPRVNERAADARGLPLQAPRTGLGARHQVQAGGHHGDHVGLHGRRHRVAAAVHVGGQQRVQARALQL